MHFLSSEAVRTLTRPRTIKIRTLKGGNRKTVQKHTRLMSAGEAKPMESQKIGTGPEGQTCIFSMAGTVSMQKPSWPIPARKAKPQGSQKKEPVRKVENIIF